MPLNEEQTLIRDSVREFAQSVLAPTAAARDESAAFPAAELAQMGELGILGLTVPAAYGGSEAGVIAHAAAVEEIAAADGAISTIMAVQALVQRILMQFGNEAQKQAWLPKLASGEAIGAFALTEPHAGSDASEVRTTARKDGDSYVLNGTKQFITSGRHGQVAIVFAVTDAAAGKKGISAFIVPTDTKGYSAPRVEEKSGQHCSDTAQVVLEDCRIPAANLLGAEGEGYKIALANLESGRISIAAQSVGMAEAALQASLAYARERTAFGKPIIEHQAVAFRLSEMATAVEAARLMVWNAARLREQNQPCLKEACMAKLTASETAVKVSSDAIQVLGGYGYTKDYPLERIWRDARVCTIYEGTSDIQKIVIARQLMKD